MVASSTRPSYALQLVLAPPWELEGDVRKMKKGLRAPHCMIDAAFE